MRAAERGFLLLSSNLGNPARKPLTTAQLRTLADRSWQMDAPKTERELELSDLTAIGYGSQMAQRILDLLSEEDVLDYYINQGKRKKCLPLTRVSDGYPLRLRKKLGLDSPGVLWAKGDVSLLEKPKVALVGSRNLSLANRLFAEEVGVQAAKQGYVLVSGNARGADRAAQDACLAAGGSVIAVVADSLDRQPMQDRVLYLSEDGFDEAFSAQRALSRNRVIHALGEKTFVAQCDHETGGTWDGTMKNLRFGWSDVFCFQDGSDVSIRLCQMGATAVYSQDLENFSCLTGDFCTIFDSV